MVAGLSVAFSNGGAHPLEDGAILKDVTALHVQISAGGQPSRSTQIGLLRQILLSKDDSTVTRWFRQVTEVRKIAASLHLDERVERDLT